MFLDGRPLRDNPLDARYFLDRGGVLERLQRSVDGRYNTLLLGNRGSGKSSTLAQLAHRLREAERPFALVDAHLASNPNAVIEMVRSALGRATSLGEAWRRLFAQAFVPPSGLSVDSQLLEAVRALHPSQTQDDAGKPSAPVPILLDGLTSTDIAFTLFGRLRDELWRLPFVWIVTGELDHEASLLAPPADAFFDVVIRLEPLTWEESQELLRLRLDGEPLYVDGINETVGAQAATPRKLLAIARDAALERRTPAELAEEMAERDLRLQALGRPAYMAFAELQALGRPVSASDQDFLDRMGWSRPRAVKVLKQLEADGFVRSSTLQAQGGGRPKVVYLPTGK